MMKKYLTLREFAKLAGVSHPAIVAAIKDGRVSRTTRGIDPDHPTNKYYVSKVDGRRQKKKGVITAKKKAVKISSNSAKSKAVRKAKAKPEIKPEKSELEETAAETEKILVRNTPKKSKKLSRKVEQNTENYDLHLGKLSADHMKSIEQVKKLQVETEIKRKQLVDRSITERVFSQLYLIDTNELKTLGDKLAPAIAAYLGFDDHDKILEVGKMIEKEIYRSLEHIKRVFNDALEEMEGDLIE